jgi:hypothetical protein
MIFANVLLEACKQSGCGTTARSGVCVRIDDRQKTDVYPGFCGISVTSQASDGSSVLLELWSAPHNAEVCEVVGRHGGVLAPDPFGASIRLTLGCGDAPRVRDLARAIHRVIRRGQQYPNPHWKWICPRTAESLERFAAILARISYEP